MENTGRPLVVRGRDVKSLDNGSQVTAGSGRTRTGLALSVLKVLFFRILGPSLSEGSPSGSVESCLSLSTSTHPLLPPASLFKWAPSGLNLPDKVRPSPAVRPWVGLVISWFRTSIQNHFRVHLAPSSPWSLGAEGRETWSQG